MNRNAEQNEILGTFMDMLAGPTGDGGNKRAAGTKPLWKEDGTHEHKMRKHIMAWEAGDRIDADSGCHPLIHVAWRALAVAWQEDEARGFHPADPEPEKFRLAREMQQIIGQRTFEEV